MPKGSRDKGEWLVTKTLNNSPGLPKGGWATQLGNLEESYLHVSSLLHFTLIFLIG